MRHAIHRGRRAHAAAVLLALAALAPASAGDAPEDAYFEELPTVLAGSRLPQRIDAAPAAVTVIDRAMIEASGAREVEDVMRLAPGMLVGHQDGAIAFVTYHALADRYARRMQVLVDGRSVYSPALGGVDWSTLPLTVDDIERVEIVRGPNAAAYGANAFLGTISITTRRASAPAELEVVSRKGGEGVDDTRLTAEHRDDRWALRMTAASWGDSGLESRINWHDDERTNLVNARLDLDLGAGDTLLLEGGLSDGWRSAGRTTRRPDPPHDRFTSSGFVNLRWSNALSADSELTLAYYDAQDDAIDRYSTLPLGGGAGPLAGLVGAIDYSLESQRRDLELQHAVRFSETLRAVYGASVRSDRVWSPAWLGTTDERSNLLYRAFGHAEWQAADDWLVNLGTMYEETRITDPGFSPRFTVTYSPWPGHTLRAGVTTATRTPVIFEQYADQAFVYQPGDVSNQYLLSTNRLDPETITTTELAWLGALPDAHLRLDLRLFRDEVRDLIVYYPIAYPDVDGQVQDFDNLMDLEVEGAELQLDWRPSERWGLVLNWSHVDSEDSNPVSDEFEESTPNQVASLLAWRRFGAIETSAGVYYRSAYDGLDTLDWVPPHARVDLRIALPVGPAGSGARLELVLQGIEGEHLDSRDTEYFQPRLIGELSFTF